MHVIVYMTLSVIVVVREYMMVVVSTDVMVSWLPANVAKGKVRPS